MAGYPQRTRATLAFPPNAQRWIVPVLIALVGVLITTGKASAQADASVSYYSTSWDFQNTDLATLQSRLAWVGIDLPFNISGTADTTIAVSVPWRQLRSARLYRLNGTIRSPRVVIDQVEVFDFSARLLYSDGVLQLQQLRFHTPSEQGGERGLFVGSARLQLIPRGDLTIRATVTDVSIPWLAGLTQQPLPVSTGRFSGQVTASVPVNKVANLAAWKAEGTARVNDFAALGFSLETATTDLKLADNKVVLSNLQANPGGGTLKANADIILKAPYRYGVAAQWDEVVASVLATLPDNLQGTIDGKSDGSLTLEGQLDPPTTKAQGTAVLEQVRLQDFVIDAVKLDFAKTIAGDLRLDAVLPIGDGSLNAAITTTTVFNDVKMKLDFQRIPLKALSPEAQGVITGQADVRAPGETFGDYSTWQGNLELAIEQPTFGAWAFQAVKLAGKLQKGSATLDSLRIGLTDSAAIAAQGNILLREPFGYSISASLPAASLTMLRQMAPGLPWPEQLEGTIEWQSDLRGDLQPFTAAGISKFTLQNGSFSGLDIPAAVVEVEPIDGVVHLTNLAVSVAGGTITGSGKLPYLSSVQEPANFLLNLDGVELSKLPAGDLKGRAMAKLSVQAPARSINDPDKWEGTVTATLQELSFHQAKLDELRVEGKLANGRLITDLLQPDLGDLAVAKATGSIAVTPPFETRLDVELTQGQLTKLGPWLTGSDLPLTGSFQSQATVTGQLQPLDFQLQGTGAAREVMVGKVAVDDVDWKYDLGPKQLHVRDIRIGLWGGTLVGDAVLPWQDGGSLTSRWTASQVQLREWGTAGAAGLLNAQADIQAPLVKVSDPQQWSGKIRATIEAAELLGRQQAISILTAAFENGQLQANGEKLPWIGDLSISANYALSDDALTLSRLRAQLLGGNMEGKGKLSFQSNVASSLDLRWSQVDVLSLMGWQSFHGLAEGDLRLTLPPAEDAEQNAVVLATSFTIPTVTNRNRAVASDIRGSFLFDNGKAVYSADAAFLGGHIHWKGSWNSSTEVENEPSSLYLEQLALGRAGALWGTDLPLAGTLTANISYHHAADASVSSAQGNISIRDVRHQGRLLAPDINGQLVYAGNSIRLIDSTGTVAGGQLRLAAEMSTARVGDARFQLSLGNAKAEDLLALVPPLRDLATGSVDLQLRGSFGKQLVAGGVVQLNRGTVADIAMSQVRLPVRGTWDLTSGRGELRIDSGSSQVALGRTTGSATITFRPQVQLQADVRLLNVDARTLLQNFTQSQLGTGRISGNVTLHGRNVRSVNDLAGTVNLSLRDTQSASFPILRELQPYLTPTAGPTAFDQGSLEGQLNNGTLRIAKMTLVGRSVQVYGDGTITFAGRLGLNVTASTGRLGANRSLLETLILRLPAVGAPPVAVLMQANEFLSDRVIHLEVTGTVRQPVIRPKAVPILGEAAIRFFLGQSLAPTP